MKLINFKVSVLGEVTRPGTYVIPDGNTTLLGALGLAGDLTVYGVRTNVLVVRNVDGKITKEKIDLTSAQFINSPYYYLKQNDMIYVQPNANREKSCKDRSKYRIVYFSCISCCFAYYRYSCFDQEQLIIS
ncbi:polysaccharide biosynthesis/export family protein [Chryseobacterium indoltheticum]|uniref:polysaccharide biosynthesis/export family protein n=1 Tax=Chryseobacterium indoltheticum TaxID=254 RepID=UPI003F494D27